MYLDVKYSYQCLTDSDPGKRSERKFANVARTVCSDGKLRFVIEIDLKLTLAAINICLDEWRCFTAYTLLPE